MRWRPPTALVVGRALGAGALVLGVAAAAGAAAVVPSQPVEVIGRSGVQAVLWPLSPIVLASVVPASTAWSGRPLDRVGRRGVRTLAVLHLTLVAASVVAVVVATPGPQRLLVARNALALVGLALLAVRVVGDDVAWVPLVALGAVTWLFGTELGGEPRPWALLLAAPRHPGAGAVGLVLTATAVVVQVATPPGLRVGSGAGPRRRPD